MTINRRWLAREWLYLLAGLLWAYVLWPIVLPPLARLVFWVWPSLEPYSRVGLGPIMFGPYVIFQVVRITVLAIRALREGNSSENS
jgi:hypothetical protein